VRFRSGSSSASNTQTRSLTGEGGRQIALRDERLAGEEIVDDSRIAHLAPEDTENAIEALSSRSDELYEERNYVLRSNAIPNDPHFAELSNPIDDTQTFVRQHYLDFLNREPDAPGLQFWTNNIESCGANVQCREVKRIDTSAAYFLSIEFQQTGYLVHRFYRASFGRRPLFSEFLTDTQAIGNGVVVNSPGWEQLLENNIRSFRDSWVTQPAFILIYDGLNNAQCVDKLIVNSGATFSSTDRDAFVDVLDNSSMTRAQVLRLIADYEAFYNSEYNAAFVEMQYFGYLRRNPNDPPEPGLNFDGYNFWLNKLNEFGGDFRKAEMVKAFLVSGEYRQRFGAP